MSRAGFVVATGIVVREAESAVCVSLSNGHRLFARWARVKNGTRASLSPGDQVRVEVPVSDPGKGFVIERLGES